MKNIFFSEYQENPSGEIKNINKRMVKIAMDAFNKCIDEYDEVILLTLQESSIDINYICMAIKAVMYDISVTVTSKKLDDISQEMEVPLILWRINISTKK